MREIFSGWIRAELAERAGPGPTCCRGGCTPSACGSRRSRKALADLDAELATGAANPTMAYLASQGQTLVRITAKAPTDDAAARADRRASRLGCARRWAT